MSDEVEAYVTRYVLTKGILKVRGKRTRVQDGWGLRFVPEGDFATVSVRQHEWHTTLDRARKRAQEVREREIKKLKRQLRDLREMQF